MTQLLAAPYSYFADANGAPLNGGQIGTFAAGTTSPKATYTDSSGITPLSNPVILDSAGRAAIWLDGNYKIVVMDALGNIIRTVDNVSSSTATGDMNKSTYDPAGIQEQVVGIDAVQTISNKTLTSPVINSPTINTATINQPNIVGVTAVSNAPAGDVGEMIEASVASGAAVSLTTNTVRNITSISLTAGDWDVVGAVQFVSASSTVVNAIDASISLTNASHDSSPDRYAAFSSNGITPGASFPLTLKPGRTRINVGATTTVYLVGRAVFNTNTETAWGYIGARRVR